ncbi:SDR family NAD(P)-dependent oxidoreductase [Alterisphingorhabdus coralli]|uniref:SDR family oxidoreductase n=1 Tax=Alterisphingorhabdus coralli TaxID=3071408 RepID=A0AA97F9R1_9SPHN|nr:SDR family oxidoreductase [Parasphingorhabdus sp. SCSIO 66989]WOE75833.1 SDR family oxidoreductase [Parasphingorhabdus sp. SCSIO 66989]
MDIKDKVIVVTGAASGIGKAMVEGFAAAGARHIVCADIDAEGVTSLANGSDRLSARGCDVSKEADIIALIDENEAEHGPIDLFCSNAGILMIGGAEVSDAEWQRIWDINVMAHVWAARHLVPRMLERGGGYLLNTASAAGLLSQIGSAPYSVTKHAAVSFAEWLAITHGDDGLKVSILCPQAVRSAMTAGHEDGVASVDGLLEADVVAQACIEAIAAEKLYVLPHPKVADYSLMRAENPDRWIAGMRKLQRNFI